MVNMALKPNTGTRPNERAAFELRPIRAARAPTGAAEAAALPISKQVCAERVCLVTQNLYTFSAAVLLRGQGRFVRGTHRLGCQPRLQVEAFRHARTRSRHRPRVETRRQGSQSRAHRLVARRRLSPD